MKCQKCGEDARLTYENYERDTEMVYQFFECLDCNTLRIVEVPEEAYYNKYGVRPR